MRYTFADGVDLNLDHLGEISRFRAVAGGVAAGPDEYALFALLAKTLRAHLDELALMIRSISATLIVGFMATSRWTWSEVPPTAM